MKIEINRTLLPLKIVLFCWYGASSALIPYMTIHMKELGISVKETAIIYTFLPLTQLFCTPLAGMIADKLGKYKDVLMLSVLSSVAFATAILFVPPVPGTRLEHPDIHLHCGPVSIPHVVVEKCWGGPCDVFHHHRSNHLEISNCSVYCHEREVASNIAIRKLCKDDVNGTHCRLFDGAPLSTANYSIFMTFDVPYPKRFSCLYPILSTKLTEDDKEHIIQDQSFGHSSSSCPMIVRDGGGVNCSLMCSFEQIPDDNGTYPHINRCLRSQGNWVLTFWLYFFLRILFNIFASICLTLLDATAIAMVEAHGGHYGRQRFWAILAQAVISLVTGFLVDILSKHKGYTDYSPAFHSYNVLAIGTAIAVWVMSVDVPPPSENVFRNFKKLLRVPPMIVLMLVIFWLGALWGFVESFLFWYLQDMGSPNYLFGLTLTTGALVGLPFLHESNWFVKRVGHVNLLLLALLFYFIRFFGYSYIRDPWYCIPFEAMEAFTYHLMWVAAATYSADLAPQGLLATVQGCVGGLHYGVGRGSGSFAGGTLMGVYGARIAFRVMGIAAGVMLIIYAIAYYGWLRRYDRKRAPRSPRIDTRNTENNTAEMVELHKETSNNVSCVNNINNVKVPKKTTGNMVPSKTHGDEDDFSEIDHDEKTDERNNVKDKR